ncbi:cob(I)yrinic acid a,c-diamide adenosyltransferase [Roseburia sp. NSJ-9]|jgi:cob(I)alamin adenosyltransferase|uniref:Cob(I)yrinic acid a,c-diamide adenosyltransferase n=2 Tax=Roseburia TaxID=841 RepID=A0ABR7GHS8_9FIRM|nr:MULTISPECIES: cob(I)yrinic acid a,c-diamide adenosyltransferase [Roseburia]MBC5686844.1 cob(I)yrinic acid a,c-diamide adenosyltransferase [Roseburia lenta]MDY3872082.1 cob(I)yrinic acid a,c-diamide adenosyltransferase [Roseburia lenta]RHO30856.1 cob(I)yrinic acid a c-diamide adenosyltransferase [Roseburia sp. AM16-25]
MDKGIIQIYYGEGQGKTSAALGNAIRKASNGQSAYVVQFMKGQLDTEYLTRLEPEVKVFRFERCSEGFDALDEAEKQEQKQNIQNGLNFAKKALVTGQCDMLVLDEVLGLVKEGMATEDQILEVLQAKSLYTDVILTGRDSLPRVFDMADNILNIVPEKV